MIQVFAFLREQKITGVLSMKIMFNFDYNFFKSSYYFVGKEIMMKSEILISIK